MTSTIKTILILLCFFPGISALAGDSPKIKHLEDVDKGSQVYSTYAVTCPDKKRTYISAWNNKKSWCVGKGRKDRCMKKKKKAAKIACSSGK